MKGIRCIVLCWLFLLLIPVNSQIKHVIVLMEENRSFDHMFGWFPGVDGLTGKECNQVNTSVPTSECIYVNQAQPQISPCDPDHGTPATTSKVFGQAALKRNDTSEATMSGFVEWEGMIGHAKTNYCDVMEMLTPNHLPIITTLASEFAIFDRFFAAYPGPTWPNRIFTLSGTSAGLTETGPWYHNEVGLLFPQPTIFDQLASEGLTWRNYFNDTPWELVLGSIAHNPENLAPMDQFYQDAALGNLPNFAWINPRSGINMTLLEGSNDHHPDHDISLGEQYYKDIYEALRSSPQWNETLFIITYDEHGGFYDHVPTPLNVPPPGDGEKSYPDEGILFDRLGIRVPTLLISPWIPKGLVISEPPSSQKPANNSEFTLTSIIATTRKILGMTSPPLTARDAWSATFEHALNLTSPRTDCPLHLPPTLPPSQLYSPLAEANMPINDLQKQILTVHAHLAGEDGIPPHVTCQAHVAEYAKMKYCEHADRTMQWKASKVDDSIVVVVRPGSSSDWLSTTWSVNVGTNVTFNTIAVFYQVNTTTVVYCLDYSNYLITGTVGVSFCYPSVDPDSNRDPGQQWIWGNDATVRPFANSTLCLTNGYLDDDVNVYLRPCDPDNVAQRYAYHGYAPGNGYSGVIYFGDSANQLGILNITALGASIDTFPSPVSHITVQ